ncbi:metallophosphoesterase family protein [Candidatus Dojkabacteria bacterium]|uniref:Metallophosphoesterase family protein n=1 Tax=Candidatus Dojkabacteria bacterium TaxID=2099670 RepID=A0A955I350_9BACT|nr:metallophosphoesterase family protein [Candidatus Dojkabacteria bacterium]
MKTLIFSDTHLSHLFDKAKYDYLSEIIDMSDHVIINGDLWEGYFTTFDLFVNSEWRRLFPLLKSKNAVYLHGNHDSPERFDVDERTGYFSVKYGVEHELLLTGKRYVIEHGDRLLSKNSNGRLRQLIKRPTRFHTYAAHAINALDYISYKGFANCIVTQPLNNRLKMTASGILDDAYLVTSHTHYSELDEVSRYINTGANRFGYGNYLLINDEGHELVSVRY